MSECMTNVAFGLTFVMNKPVFWQNDGLEEKSMDQDFKTPKTDM